MRLAPSYVIVPLIPACLATTLHTSVRTAWVMDCKLPPSGLENVAHSWKKTTNMKQGVVALVSVNVGSVKSQAGNIGGPYSGRGPTHERAKEYVRLLSEWVECRRCCSERRHARADAVL
jgi:hypothetical protein